MDMEIRTFLYIHPHLLRGYVLDNTDCDDSNAAINPVATEVFDGVDNDCDGVIDEGFNDADGDGYTSDIDCDAWQCTSQSWSCRNTDTIECRR